MTSVNLSPGSPFSEADINSNTSLPDQAQHEVLLLASNAEAELVSYAEVDLASNAEVELTSDVEVELTSDAEAESLQLETATQPLSAHKELHGQHTGIRTQTQLYKTALSPVQAIPTEILSEIFAQCVSTISVPVELLEEPWNLARVCSKWRQVAMGAPTLWSKIEVDYRKTQSSWAQVTLTDMANEILSRCRNISVSIRFLGIFGREDSEAFTGALNGLTTSHSTRLSSVVLKLNIDCGTPFFQLPPGSLRLIDTVELSFESRFTAQNDITVFQNAPRLHHVTLGSRWNDGEYLHPFAFKLPWSQLTHLFIRKFSVYTYEAHLLLRQCTCLLECHLCIRPNDINSQHSSLMANLGPTRLHSLTSLSIRYMFGLVEFIQNLDLPQLLDLEVFNSKQSSRWLNTDWSDAYWGDHLIPFLRRISSLRRLCVRQVVPETVIEQVLRAVPTITTLAIQDGDALPDGVLELISQGYLIPKVDDICYFVVKLDPFLDMLEARGSGFIPCPKFKKIFIDLDTNGGGAGYPSRQRVKTLQATGYNITLCG